MVSQVTHWVRLGIAVSLVVLALIAAFGNLRKAQGARRLWIVAGLIVAAIVLTILSFSPA